MRGHHEATRSSIGSVRGESKPDENDCAAMLNSGQIRMRKVDGWQSLSEKGSDQIIDLAA